MKVTNAQELTARIKQLREAQKKFATYTQEQVDEIFRQAALAANHNRIKLAKLAVEETGMGIVEDKVVKNNFAAEYIYNQYKNMKTCGVLEEDKTSGITKVAEPIGVISAIVPTTNPTSTAIFKCLIALKTRNAIIISPHPRAKNATIEAARIVLEAAVKAGAPEGIIGWIDQPSVELSQNVMRESDIILATGGPAMVKAAYSSGRPALGVGAGNTPAIIDESAHIKMAVNSILLSKTFDNGVICASEQSIIVLEEVYDEVKKELAERGAYILKGEEIDKVRSIILNEKGGLNADMVGQSAYKIAKMEMVRNLKFDDDDCYISIEDMAIYNEAEAAAIPDKIDLIYTWQRVSTYGHSFAAPAADSQWLPDINLPAGVNRDAKIRREFGMIDSHLTDEPNNGTYIDDIDFETIDLSNMPDYIVNMKDKGGMWIETQDGKYRAFIYLNSLLTIPGGTLSMKRYTMK